MTAQLLHRFMRVGNALYPEEPFVNRTLHIVLCETDYCARLPRATTRCILNSQTESSRPSHLYQTTR